MTPRETILKAFEGGKPGRVPVTLFGGGMWSISNWGSTFEELSRNPDKMTQMLIEMSDKLQCDIVYAGSGYNNFHAAALGGKIKFREVGAPDLEAPLVDSEEDLAKLKIEDIDKDETINTIKEALRKTKEKIGNTYVVTMTAWGPFTLAARIVGEEQMMKATFKKPDFVEKAIDFATELLIHLYKPLVDDGTLEVISLADPTASGDLISKKQFQKFALPALRRFTDWARSKDVHVLLHICGNTTDRLEMFPDTGASCISLDHKTDIAKAKEVLYGKICFGGNVDPVAVMLQGDTTKVEETCKGIIEKAGTNGAFVLMPGCDIPPNVPYENIQMFIQVARQWRL
jgi:uroporphyrinogen decarboxylase